MFSARSEAYLVKNLLSSSHKLEGNSNLPETPYFAKHGRESVCDSHWEQTEKIGNGDHGTDDISRSGETWCGCQKLHPSVITNSGVIVELCNGDVWNTFHRLGTEMIITKVGRRMFPSLRFHLRGLDPDALYRASLEFAHDSVNKYRYVYQRSRWVLTGLGEQELAARLRTYSCPDSPCTGRSLMGRTLSLERVKLNNSTNGRSDQVTLSSMQRFQPTLHVQKVSGSEDDTMSRGDVTLSFAFPQTVFMAVTAYQNSQITHLKISTNPFAKGFRDSGKSKHICRDPLKRCSTEACPITFAKKRVSSQPWFSRDKSGPWDQPGSEISCPQASSTVADQLWRSGTSQRHYPGHLLPPPSLPLRKTTPRHSLSKGCYPSANTSGMLFPLPLSSLKPYPLPFRFPSFTAPETTHPDVINVQSKRLSVSES